MFVDSCNPAVTLSSVKAAAESRVPRRVSILHSAVAFTTITPTEIGARQGILA